MYDHSSDSVLHGTGEETFDAVKMLKSADPAKYTPAPRRQLSRKDALAIALRQLAQLIKANLGVQIAFADIGGWDHHVNEGATEGQLANVLTRFLAIDRGVLDRSRRSWRRHGCRHHVGVRPHRARKWQSRYRSRPRERNVRSWRAGERRQSLRALARASISRSFTKAAISRSLLTSAR